MSRSFSDFTAIVDFLVRNQGMSLDQALGVAQVPLHYVEQVRAYISGPVEITSPDILSQQQSVPLCQIPSDSLPQPFSEALWTFLANERRWSRSVIESLQAASLELLTRLPQPALGEAFQTRGLVVGHIQSGKTANMAALIARAADQGYKLVVIFAGLMKDLRAQTQKRLDQEIAGTSDNDQDGPFVEHYSWAAKWVRLTRSGLNGEFQPGTHNDLNPQTPKIAVLKKHPRVLERFTDWLRWSPVPLRDLPALVIDDEADQASIDTNYGRVDESGEELDPTKTNARIRELLETLPKCVYVGFTATPFANVLIDVNVERDLFPRDFIAALPEPPGYFGPRKLFGLGMTPSELSGDAPELPSLDVIRHISHDDLDELDRLTVGGCCPAILTKALLTFVLSCCGRLARGHEREHFTMLVHPSQRTEEHFNFSSCIEEELGFLREVVKRSKNFPDVIGLARHIWESDFMRVTQSVHGDFSPSHDFDTIWRFAKVVTDPLELCTLNVRSQDELDYSGAPKRYVVVGGNRLSRGLTLEGLSVSLFTRDTNYYDSLLQMGRWFGFRPSYHDLTRIFVEERMANAFADLARVEMELREDLRKYARQQHPPTPGELAPKVRAHPAMEVTNRMKMGAARNIRLSFQNTTQNTITFPVNSVEALRRNQDSARALISSLGPPQTSQSAEGMHIFKDVPSGSVLDFINSYTFGPRSQVVSRAPLMNYVQMQNDRGELLFWDIVIPKGNPKREIFRWTNEVFARRVLRTPTRTASIKVLQNPADIQEWRDLARRSPEDPTRGCLIFYLIDKDSGQPESAFFPSSVQPEDILGFVLVFPSSRSNATIEYVSQHDQ